MLVSSGAPLRTEPSQAAMPAFWSAHLYAAVTAFPSGICEPSAGRVIVTVGGVASTCHVTFFVFSKFPAMSVEWKRTECAPVAKPLSGPTYGENGPPASEYSVMSPPEPSSPSVAVRVSVGLTYQPFTAG